ncbi:MAG: hypothetical protein [Zuhalvirus cruti]|uniref:Uncharacterized protein n=1 Tax=Cressdnaviricota sp. TaxID=2748378 RepID=A0A3G2YT87_9VIRU|nr:MAG: hypothetical protein [Cressdnaviricota sp.]
MRRRDQTTRCRFRQLVRMKCQLPMVISGALSDFLLSTDVAYTLWRCLGYSPDVNTTGDRPKAILFTRHFYFINSKTRCFYSRDGVSFLIYFFLIFRRGA